MATFASIEDLLKDKPKQFTSVEDLLGEKPKATVSELGELGVRRLSEVSSKLLETGVAASPIGFLEALQEKAGIPQPFGLRRLLRTERERQERPELERRVREEFPIGAPVTELAAELPLFAIPGAKLSTIAAQTPAKVGAILGGLGGLTETVDQPLLQRLQATGLGTVLGGILGKGAEKLRLDLPAEEILRRRQVAGIAARSPKIFKSVEELIEEPSTKRVGAFITKPEAATSEDILSELLIKSVEAPTPRRVITRKKGLFPTTGLTGTESTRQLRELPIGRKLPKKFISDAEEVLVEKPRILIDEFPREFDRFQSTSPKIQASTAAPEAPFKSIGLADDITPVPEVDGLARGGRTPESIKRISGHDNITDPALANEIDVPFIANKVTKAGKQRPSIRRSGFYAKKAIETHDIVDEATVSDTPLSAALRQDNIPRQAGQFGPVMKNIHEPSQRSIANEITFGNEQAGRFVGIADSNGIKISKKNGATMKRVMETIPNSDLESLDVGQLAAKYSDLNVDNRFFSAAKEYRVVLDDLREMSNVVRRNLGKEEIGFLDSYVPHMQRASGWLDNIGDKQTTISDVFDFIVPNAASNRFAFKRLNQLRPEELEQNFFKLTDAYINAIGKDIHITPAIENIKVHNEVLRGRGLNKTANFWDDFIRTGLLGKAHKIDQVFGIEKGSLANRALLKLAEIRVKGGLVGNVTWSVVTQPSSLLLTLKETGVKNTLLGALDWFTNPALRKELLESATSLRIKTQRGSTISFRGISDKLNKRVFKSRVNKFNDFLSLLADAEERHLQGLSISAGLREGKRLGFGGDDLLTFANAVGERTQSMYNRGSRPLIQNSVLFRSSFPFQTFSFEMWRGLKEIVANKGFKASGRLRLGMAANALVGMALANQYSNLVRGRDVFSLGSAVPVAGPFLEKSLAKQFDPSKQFTFKGRSRAPIAALEDFEQLASGIGDFVNTGNTRRLRKSLIFYGTGILGIGGGAQLNRLVDGIIAAERGAVTTKKGKALFPVKGPAEITRAIIKGPSGTEAAKAFREREERKSGRKPGLIEQFLIAQ